MRIDHIVIHVDNDPQKVQRLSETMNPLGYPFDPEKGKRNNDYRSNNIPIGSEYIEIVRILKPEAQSWMPLWAHYYDEGKRGAYCIFLEVEDVERTAVAIKRSGIRLRGPAVLTYPGLLGLLRTEAPYIIYYLPTFPDTHLQLALMQYKKQQARESFIAGMGPNANDQGINGIRRVEVELPNLDESTEMLQKVFSSLQIEGGEWIATLEKQRMIFRSSADQEAHVRIQTVTSQKAKVGNTFQVDNVEVITTGG